jgi:hypothetical protein
MFPVFFLQERFPGLLVKQSPEKCAQKLGRLLRHMFCCCALAGGFWAHPFLNATCTDFCGGLVQAALERACGRW